MARGNVLIAHDDTVIRIVLNQALARAGFAPRVTEDPQTLWTWISRGDGDVILTDILKLDGEASDLAARIRDLRPHLPIIILSSDNLLMASRTAMEIGAFEFLPTPLDVDDLISVVTRAIAEPKERETTISNKHEAEEPPLIGRSWLMQDLCRTLARLSQSDLAVMITGESGTGKQLAARALHDFGSRRLGPFVTVNFAAMPHDQSDGVLFGSTSVDSSERTGGRFAAAGGGTLFLDEIGDMSLETQKRLLHRLQLNENEPPAGARETIEAKVRIVAATNCDLNERLKQGLFREDLFYRLNVAPIRLPSLRERVEDIGDLAHHFLRRAAREGLGLKSIERNAIECLKAHSWPGNVRELENVIRRLVVLDPKGALTAEAVERELSKCRAAALHPRGAAELSLNELVQGYLAQYFSSFGNDLPPPGLYGRVIRDVEKPLLSFALAATRGNQLRAAELLGLNRNTLRVHLRELDIPDFRVTDNPTPKQTGRLGTGDT